MFIYYDERSNRLRANGCERYGDWWVPEDCPTHLGGAA